MIAIWVVAVWLVVGLVFGVVFGTAMRKARGEDSSVIPVQPAEVRFLRKGKRGSAVAHDVPTRQRKHLAKQRHAVA